MTVKAKYHYTIAYCLGSIISSGQINIERVFNSSPTERAVWTSTNPFWEKTANKMVPTDGKLVVGNKKTTHDIGGGLARIEVADAAAPYSWKEYIEITGMEKRIRKALAKGNNTGLWFVSFKPIVSGDWLSIQVFDWGSQSWKPY